MRKFFWRILFLVLALLAGAPVMADHGAVAYTLNGEWGGWAVKSTRKAAELAALQACRSANPPEKCELLYTVAVSRAEGARNMGLSGSLLNKAEAERLALKNCDAPDCRIVWTKTAPGFFAKFHALQNGEVVNSYIQYGGWDGTSVQEEGKRNCESANNLPCEFVTLGVIKGVIGGKEQVAQSKPQISEKSCRPNTPTIRCSSQCTNGNCVITYENGCKMRVQVQPKFDPFNNQWTYPAPSC